MIALEEAQQRLLALAKPLDVENLPLTDALRRWAAEPVLAKRTQPARNLSAMDGYALRFADLGREMRVIGESAAGRAFTGSVGNGEAVRIFTGAVVPEGADTILIQEDAERTGDCLSLAGDGHQRKGAHIRAIASDFGEGNELVAKGEVFTPARIALAAMGGHAKVSVCRKPRISVVSTGDELCPPGMPTLPDQIPSSNASMLMAMLGDLAVDANDEGILPDRLDVLTNAFASFADRDIIVTLGGASVGDHDLVKPAFEAAGANIDVWKVAMRPGKPVMFGTLGNAIVLGLPGNPVSAFVTALLFLKPLVRALGGAKSPLPVRSSARAGTALPENGPRIDHIRARLDGGIATPTGMNDSAALAALSASDALIVRAPHAKATEIGEIVEVILL